MFDSLRRAEAARRKKTVVAKDPGEPQAEGTITAGPIVTQGIGRLEGVPDEFVRELGILRNSVEAALGKKEKRTLLFVGSTPEEGTTTLVSGFAELLSVQSREKILLIEMNARRPSLKWKFRLSSENGVTHYFSGQRSLESILQKTHSGGYDVAHVGDKDPAKIQLHLELMFPKLIQEARKLYDTILIDAPPVIGSPETPPLTSFVDGTVLVVRSGKTKREIVLRSLNMIGQFEGRVLGVVLNRKKYYIPDFIYRRI
jgi:Mrp family chromosome partitioning ATPase